jgi:hypothetical protein
VTRFDRLSPGWLLGAAAAIWLDESVRNVEQFLSRSEQGVVRQNVTAAQEWSKASHGMHRKKQARRASLHGERGGRGGSRKECCFVLFEAM